MSVRQISKRHLYDMTEEYIYGENKNKELSYLNHKRRAGDIFFCNITENGIAENTNAIVTCNYLSGQTYNEVYKRYLTGNLSCCFISESEWDDNIYQALSDDVKKIILNSITFTTDQAYYYMQGFFASGKKKPIDSPCNLEFVYNLYIDTRKDTRFAKKVKSSSGTKNLLNCSYSEADFAVIDFSGFKNNISVTIGNLDEKATGTDMSVYVSPVCGYIVPLSKTDMLCYGTVASDWTQGTNRNTPISVSFNGNNISVQSPLSKANDTLTTGQRVLFMEFNGQYVLIQAEC